jgi:hypothetical protein
MEDLLPQCILPPSDKTVWAPPLDAQDLAVRLEASGVTDQVAHSRYGFRDLWQMAEAYLRVAQAQPPKLPHDALQQSTWRNYLKGMAFATPAILCCLIVLFVKVPLWGGPISGNQAVAIAVAAIAGFIVTGGFLQIIGRLGYFYKESKEWALCSRSCWSAVKLGVLALCAVTSMGFVLNAFFQWLPADLYAWCVVFNLGIGFYILISGVLHILEAKITITVGTLLGMAVVGYLFLSLHVPLMVSQICGITVATITCLAVAEARFRRMGSHLLAHVKLPPVGQLVYSLFPYFLYGGLYYAFLFADRIIAWSARTESASLPLQFRGAYEAALDLCLFAFIVQVGWIHVGLVKFYRFVSAKQRRLYVKDRAALRKYMMAFYQRQILVFGLLFLGSSAVVAAAIYAIPSLRAVILPRVALLAMLGMPFLAIGLWNIALLFALSRPMFAVSATTWSLITNVAVGYLLSRMIAYDLAIIGFLIGACALSYISARYCRRTLAHFDYYFFASAT